MINKAWYISLLAVALFPQQIFADGAFDVGVEY